MKPAKTLARINRQVFRSAQPTQDQVVEFFHATDGAIWLYDQQSTVQPQRMLAVIRHCAEKLGCKHIVVGILMKCVKGDDYNGQKDFVDALTAAARDHNIHIHLVAHLRKGEGDERLPTRMDIKGSGSITDLVDQVLILWRNKSTERKAQHGEAPAPGEPDTVLICDKSRNGEWEGRVKLGFDSVRLRFLDL